MNNFDEINWLERLQDLTMPKYMRDVLQDLERAERMKVLAYGADRVGAIGLDTVASRLREIETAIGQPFSGLLNAAELASGTSLSQSRTVGGFHDWGENLRPAGLERSLRELVFDRTMSAGARLDKVAGLAGARPSLDRLDQSGIGAVKDLFESIAPASFVEEATKYFSDRSDLEEFRRLESGAIAFGDATFEKSTVEDWFAGIDANDLSTSAFLEVLQKRLSQITAFIYLTEHGRFPILMMKGNGHGQQTPKSDLQRRNQSARAFGNSALA